MLSSKTMFQNKSWALKLCFKASWKFSLRLEFHEAWKHSSKAQLLAWSHSFTAKYLNSKTVFQTKSWALMLCFQASWNSSLWLHFHQAWNASFKSYLLAWSQNVMANIESLMESQPKGPVSPGFKTQFFLLKIETQRLDEVHLIYVEHSNDTYL